jgi:phosphorylcholine metabolism protein LicD
VIHERIEVVCEEDDACEELVWVSEDDDIDLDLLHGEDHELILFQEATGDSEEMVEIHPGEHHKKVIIIRDRSDSE